VALIPHFVATIFPNDAQAVHEVTAERSEHSTTAIELFDNSIVCASPIVEKLERHLTLLEQKQVQAFFVPFI